MKNQIKQLLIALALLALSTLNPQLSTLHAQGTAFTYQGQLQNNGSPASGTYNLTFTLFNNTNAYVPPVAGPVTNNGVLVANGLFTVTIDFGSGVWNGQTNWLQIGVETNGVNSFTVLTPSQQLTPMPYAIFAESASNLLGALPASQLITVSGGYGNFFVGMSGNPAATGPYNTAIGYSALNANGDGADNTAVGAEALSANTTGYYNTAEGNNALSANTTGSYNTANGYGALYENTSGSENTANGGYALSGNTSGTDNTANGFYALSANTTGSYNTANGYGALYANTSGTDNTADGVSSLFENTTGSYNTANGYGALYYNTTGSYNTANGPFALYVNTTGTYNTANGAESLYANTIGSDNTVDGAMALFNNTCGSQNMADGYQSLYNNRSGNNNTAIGMGALQYLGYFGAGGTNNIALGFQAGYNLSGNESYNIEIGNLGVAGDYDTIRIGDPTIQTNTLIAGVINGNGGGLTNLNISAAQFSGINNSAVAFSNANNRFYGSFAGNGGGLTNLNVAALNGLNATNFWQTTGNSGTTAGVNFVGTTDNQPLELHVNYGRALRLEPTAYDGNHASIVNVVEGSAVNYAGAGVYGATVSGGGALNYFGGAASNSVTADFGTVGGGFGNTAGGLLATVGGGAGNTASGLLAFIGGGFSNTNSGTAGTIGGGELNTASGTNATVGGGALNTAGGIGSFVGGGGFDGSTSSGNSALGNASVIGGGLGNTNSAEYGIIGGGYQNFIQPGSSPVIGGGSQNVIKSNSYEATIAGGWANVIGTNANQATIGGGSHNTTSGYYATVPGGANNLAGGQFSFAAGDQAQATNDGAFVWTDAEGTPFASTTTNQFNVRANGGVVFVTGGAGMTIDGQPVLAGSNGGGLINLNASQLTSIGNTNGGASGNFFVGPSGNATTTGSYNAANGFSALANNTSGSDNTADGVLALANNTSGSDNTADGFFALVLNTSGSNNTASGYGALAANTSGSNNIALGFLAGANLTTGSYNIDIGNEGLSSDTNIIRIGSGQSSTFIAGVITNTGTMALHAGTDMELDANHNLNTTLGADMTVAAQNMTTTLTANMNLTAHGQVNVTAGTTMDLQSGTTMTVGSGAAMQIVSGAALNLSGTQLTLNGGNVGIGNSAPGNLLVVGTGGAYCNGTTWVNGSDRNSKENFAAIKPADVLAKVAALPITEWKYKTEADGTEHLGPMAQDFHAAFGLNGADDKHIATVDEEGVALAAIQGLNQKLEETRAENADLKQRLAALEKIVLNQKSN